MKLQHNHLQEKKLFYLEGIGEGVYQISTKTLGSFEDKIFKRILINKFDKYNINDLTDYFEIEYVYEQVTNSIEITCDFFIRNINSNKDINITNKIIYSKTDEENVQKDYYWTDNEHLPYVQSVDKKLDMCIPKVFNHIYLCDLNYLIRCKQIYIFN